MLYYQKPEFEIEKLKERKQYFIDNPSSDIKYQDLRIISVNTMIEFYQAKTKKELSYASKKSD